MRPIVIAGGGLAGAAAACLLARAGRSVCVIERDRIPRHKVCGEFLSFEAQIYLSELGLDLAALGAVPITHVRLSRRNKTAAARLPFVGAGLTRRVLDEALLHQAALSGAEILRGHVIRDVDTTRGTCLNIEGLGEVRTETLFLANGKHDLRGVPRARRSSADDLIGLKSYFHLTPSQQSALRSHVEIALFRGGYAGLQMVEGQVANLCLLVRRERFAQSDHNWRALLAGLIIENAHLRERLAGAVEQLDRPVAIYRLPYGFLHAPQPEESAAIFRLGDQLAVTPSFTGDGMSIALHAAFTAVDTYLAGDDAATYHRRMRRDVGTQIRRAGLLSSGVLATSGQAVLMAAARAMPSLLQEAASATRLSMTSITTHPTAACMPE